MRWLTLVLLLPLPAAGQCRLEGTVTDTTVRVRPDGAEPFQIELVDHDIGVTFGRSPRLRLHGLGALIFTASVQTSQVPIALVRSRRVGPLMLRPGTAISSATRITHGMRVTLRLVEGVTVVTDLPCRAIRLGAPAEPPETAPAGAVERGTILSVARRMSVHSAHDAAAGSVRLHITSPIRFAELARRDGWVRIRRDFMAGTTLDGWVLERDVRVVEEAEIRGVLMGTMIGSSEWCGHGASHSYTGPATLRQGSIVFDSRAGARWARARVDTEVRVHFAYGDDWVRVEQLPGFRNHGGCPNTFERSWVRRADVRVPRREAPAGDE